ncbi:Rv3235 family protein, partial [Nocardia higoensis]|uniref:Rv3235 family protein n=1 Tax=Nocardia higoensis TaxID=228599 RepID=UPI0002D80CA8
MRAAHAAERTEASAEVAGFADRSLRAVLEVLDRRRPVEQLAGIADPLVLAAVRTLVARDLAPERALGSAVLARIDVRLVAADSAELWARYNRGGRRFALAAGAVRRRATGWRLTALRVR